MCPLSWQDVQERPSVHSYRRTGRTLYLLCQYRTLLRGLGTFQHSWMRDRWHSNRTGSARTIMLESFLLFLLDPSLHEFLLCAFVAVLRKKITLIRPYLFDYTTQNIAASTYVDTGMELEIINRILKVVKCPFNVQNPFQLAA